MPLISGVVGPADRWACCRWKTRRGDNKLLAVPIDAVLSLYTQWQSHEDLNPLRLKTIQHFFEHYKDLEQGKWVKVLGWQGPDAARTEVETGMAAWTARSRN